MPRGANWIAADWGTTHLRVWHLASNGQVLGEARSDKGMAALSSGEFEEALLELAEPWLPPVQQTDIVACGMVGARQGWIEAKYTAVPAMPAPGTALTRAPCADDRMRVFIIPGLKQACPSVAAC
ncbi:MAG: 2-dehydro-3-deoxygalactonokinase [Pseudomonadota bacterium]